MSSSFLYFLLSFVNLIWPAYSATCQPRAINLPYKSQGLATQTQARGVLWQIGGPSKQNITLMPSAWYNDTYLWSATNGFCPSQWWTNNSPPCATYRGGLYDRSISQTEKDTANQISHTFDDTIANWTRDDITLEDNSVLPQYEFALRTGNNNPFTSIGEIGLGRSSSFLKTLSENKNISSRSYSFFTGTEVTTQSRDGSFTLGGFDQALIAKGTNVTSPFVADAKCKEGIIVTLTSLSLQTSDGKTQDAWENLADLRVCVIAATSNIMTIPVEYWDPIQSIMGVERNSFRNGTAETQYYNTTLIKPSPNYSGNMSIVINSAMTVDIPNEQLIFGEHYIDTKGFVQAKTDINQIPIARINPGDGMMPRLGGQFFSNAYLIVNHDKNEFTIAPTVAKSTTPKIMAFDTANNCIAPIEAAVASGSPTPSSTGSSSPKASDGSNANNSSQSTASKKSSKLGGGAIAGIVIGVLAGIAIVAIAAFILWRRKRRAGPKLNELPAYGAPTEKYAYRDASEMYAENGHELGHERGFAHELDGAGRPHEVSGMNGAR
ncbi:hypothetical protein EK21DRAFT_80075 [Setomelanomma holmii]|uniref:Peptidase A1 domain-containing protein n=1 Tax=Setomelanomma holmii TaxID=210430 RepID=A0A9P4LGQ3_9PLEO|nr:hypothetical protein EK21DRAFT_80075 [Setomelanomma holmii]